jgi:hypothetical protein
MSGGWPPQAPSPRQTSRHAKKPEHPQNYLSCYRLTHPEAGLPAIGCISSAQPLAATARPRRLPPLPTAPSWSIAPGGRQHEVDPHPATAAGAAAAGRRGHPPAPHQPARMARSESHTQMPGREHPRRHGNRLGDGRDSSADGSLNAQRRSSGTGGLGGFPPCRTSVAISIRHAGA